MAPLFFLSAGLSADNPDSAQIALLPLGKFPAERVHQLQTDLQRVFVGKVQVLPARTLPAVAFYPPRSRYRADKLLTWSDSLTMRASKVVMFTAVDISTEAHGVKDWGVFGLGQISGRASVVSTFRLKGSYEDLRKIAIHEVGRTLGLPHCATTGCVMQDAEGSIRTVRAGKGAFCGSCVQKAKAWIRPRAK